MNDKPTISVIGLGRFGTLVTAILSSQTKVMVYHYKNSPEIQEKVNLLGVELVDLQKAASADIVILCVPIHATEKMIKDISPLMKEGSLLIDTCSVKIDPCNWLISHTSKDIDIVGTHPMFGPVTTSFDLKNKSYILDGLQIILCPLRIMPVKLEMIEKFLKSLGLNVIITTPEDHDEQNAKTLSLVHFLGRGLSAAGINDQSIFTPGYTDLLKIYRHTTSDNWQLFYDMNNFNSYSLKVRERMYEEFFGLEERIVKSKANDDFDFHRRMIDMVDGVMLNMLEKRFRHVRAIGEIKKEKGILVTDKTREEEIINSRCEHSQLENDFLRELYEVIFKEAKRLQK